jgi:hypothetical protein
VDLVRAILFGRPSGQKRLKTVSDAKRNPAGQMSSTKKHDLARMLQAQNARQFCRHEGFA